MPRREPYKLPARHADAPVTGIEIRTVLRLAERRWWQGNQPPDLCHRGLLVLQYPAMPGAPDAGWGRVPLAAWLVDMGGTREIDRDDARALMDEDAASNPFFQFPRIYFAPRVGSNELVVWELYAHHMGYAQSVGISARGGVRWARFLWMK